MGFPGVQRLSRALLGPASTRRLTVAHSLNDFADAMINLSLVGSLFFAVSFDASRERILLYLVLAAAPLALVAPVVGPLLDRTRIGYRTMLASSQILRVGLALGLASSLGTLAFYPLAFGVLLARKAYALARTGVLAQLAPSEDELVAASGHLARTGTLAGGVGTALAGILLAVVGVWVLPLVAAVFFLGAALVSFTIAPATPRHDPEQPVGTAVVSSDVRAASFAVAALQAGVGALTLLLALAIKRGGGDAWVFASALVAAGAGSFLGTIAARRANRRMTPDRVIAFCLLVPGIVTFAGVLSAGQVGIVVIATALGFGASVAARSIDVLFSRVPDRTRGRAVSISQLRFQLANVLGASLAVLIAPSPKAGFAVVAAVLVVSAAAYASSRRVSLRREAGRLLIGDHELTGEQVLGLDLLDEAEFALARRRPRVAIILASCAARVSDLSSAVGDPADVHAAIDDITAGQPDDAERARRLIDAIGNEVAARAATPRDR